MDTASNEQKSYKIITNRKTQKKHLTSAEFESANVAAVVS